MAAVREFFVPPVSSSWRRTALLACFAVIIIGDQVECSSPLDIFRINDDYIDPPISTTKARAIMMICIIAYL